jgi:hypothetical protein
MVAAGAIIILFLSWRGNQEKGVQSSGVDNPIEQ